MRQRFLGGGCLCADNLLMRTALVEDGMITGLGDPTTASSATRLDATVGEAAAPSTLKPTTLVYGCELMLDLRNSEDRRSEPSMVLVVVSWMWRIFVVVVDNCLHIVHNCFGCFAPMCTP